MFVTSLNYFSGLVEEVAELSMGEDYWKHVQHKVIQLEGMWRESSAARQSQTRDEMKETK